MFFTPQDIAIVGVLIFLEGILSIDNAVVLAILAKTLPPEQRKRALTYGLVGAFVFRLAAIGLASTLMTMNWVKFVGGGYLVWIALQDLLKKKDEKEREPKKRSFWKTVIMIELTDIAFAIDSILAAVALSNKYWVIVTGGIAGMLLMRFSAVTFVKLLDRFPHLERAAYQLVLLIGIKVIVEGLRLPWIHFHSVGHPSFLAFWGIFLVIIFSGFKSTKSKAKK